MPADQDEGQRKLTAILAADVAGYSKLMADDDRETVRTLTAYRQVFSEQIEARQGRIVDTAGDSVLATFESVIEAVEAAVEIQRVLAGRNTALSGHRQMHFRMGVNLGDIIIRDDGTIYGDGVNVAARLEGLAAPGGIMIADVARQTVEGKLAVGLEDAGAHDVKNIAAPVRAWRVLVDGSEATPSTTTTIPPISKTLRRPKVIAGLAAALAVIVGLAVWGVTVRVEVPQMVMADGTPTDDPGLAMPQGPTVAVFPFKNLSGDPSQDYFADGIAEDILTRLSLFGGITVLSRTSSFQHRNDDLGLTEIAQRIGANYVLEGTVRRDGDDLRITAQLTDGENAAHVWAANYDRDLSAAGIFDVQDEIVNAITAALGDTTGVIIGAEISGARQNSPGTLESYECVLLAAQYTRVVSLELHLAARECLEAETSAHPDYAEAWAWLSLIYRDELFGFNEREGVDAIQESYIAAVNAIEIDPSNQRALLSIASRHFWMQDSDAFRQAAEKAIAANPNASEVLADMGLFAYHAGHVEWGLALAAKAIELTPNSPAWYYAASFFNAYRIKAYELALAEAKKSKSQDDFWSWVRNALAHAQLGHELEAQKAAQKLVELNPDFATREGARAELEFWEWHHRGELAHWMEGLEKAGLFDEPEAPSRPVIAVLPFANMSGDPEHEFFADGITEDIITRLARFPDIGVIARNSSFQYKGENVDIRTVAEDLGATYVLEGSVRRSEDDIRVTAQLLDASDGTHLWAETYDRDLSAGSIFEIQDNVTERVVGAIASMDSTVAQTSVQASAMKAPSELSSYECVVQAGEYWRSIAPDVHLRARTCLENVLRDEPDFARAWTLLAAITTEEFLYGYNALPESDPPLDRALDYARRAIDLDPRDAWAHWNVARVAYHSNKMSQSRSATDRALILAPNDAMLLAGAGIFISYSGDWEDGIALMDRAIELNPHHQPWYHLPYFYDAYRQGLDEAALDAALKVDMPGFFWAHQVVAAAYAQLGMQEEATAAVARLHKLWPGYSIQTMTDMHRLWNYEDDVIERMADGLRKAGLPEVSG